MIRPQFCRLDGQGALVSFLRFVIAPLIFVDSAQVVICVRDLDVVGTKCFFADREASELLPFRLLETTESAVHVGNITNDCAGLSMLGTFHLSHDWKRTLVELQRLFELRIVLIKEGQIVERNGNLVMVGIERPLTDFQGAV